MDDSHFIATKDELQNLGNDLDLFLYGVHRSETPLRPALVWLDGARDELSTQMHRLPHALEIAQALRKVLHILVMGKRSLEKDGERATLSAPCELLMLLRHRWDPTSEAVMAPQSCQESVAFVAGMLSYIASNNELDLVDGAISTAEAAFVSLEQPPEPMPLGPAGEIVVPPQRKERRLTFRLDSSIDGGAFSAEEVDAVAAPSRLARFQRKLLVIKHKAFRHIQHKTDPVEAFLDQVTERYVHICAQWAASLLSKSTQVLTPIAFVEDFRKEFNDSPHLVPTIFDSALKVLIKRATKSKKDAERDSLSEAWDEVESHLKLIAQESAKSNSPRAFDHALIGTLLETADAIYTQHPRQAATEAWRFDNLVQDQIVPAARTAKSQQHSIGHRAARRYNFDRDAFMRRANGSAH